ncbi:GNAT family N-acetyltransferase [Sulfobacillus harzensis]|uniref:GNAT family N-acetyltransferase n=1 Tax=Sulfobacillus harzensis TaxID=2729629 RepID=A0A7Y0Q5D4_9FIRM|nr:GNAT family N-acetyltransferase [Sulfobacillus harzensis]
MSLELRVARPDDMEEIGRLSDQVFRAKRGGHMADEFPYLYDPANAHHWYVAFDQGRAVSIVGAMNWPVVIAGAATRAASVGSVATDPAYRGRGLASQLLQLAQKQLADEDVRVMLISGDLSLYTRFGARAIGWVDWYRLNPDSKKAPTPYHVRPIDPLDDAPVVARLNQTRGTRFGRSLPQLRAMLASQPMTQVEQGTKVALMVMAEGQAVSYLILNHRPFQGRGASRLSEWAGDPKGVLSALRSVQNWPEGGIEVPVLRDDWSLLAELRGSERVRSEPVSWLAKVIDGQGLSQDLQTVWAEVADRPLAILRLGEEQYKVRVGSEQWSVDAAELTEWVFGTKVPHRPASLECFWPIPSLWPEGLNYI